MNNIDKETSKQDFINNNLFGNTVEVNRALTLDETLEIDGVRKYAGLKVAPKIVISPMSREELIARFGERGVPVKYYNHIKRLSDYRRSQMLGQKSHKFVSVNVYDDHMERDNDATNKMLNKMTSEGITIMDNGNF